MITRTGEQASDDYRLGTLADPSRHRDTLELKSSDRKWLRRALDLMIGIRVAEEKIADMVTAGVIRCPCHLAIGQEAAAVGVAHPLRTTDRVFGAHRSHGHYIALGGALHGLMAEVLGKNTGVSRGMGGSMHLIDTARGLFGTVPIVGATIPIATGAGLAAKLEGKGDIAVSFFGDGATEEGGFHESMNLAAALKLPVLFVCENNLFSSHLHIDIRQPANSVSRYAEAHRVAWDRVDGNDVVEVSRAASEAVRRMRAEPGPHFLELVTYRWRGHVGPREDEDVGVRRKDDLGKWKDRDPIRRLAAALSDSGLLTDTDLQSMWQQHRADVDRAWEQATKDPYPTPDQLLARVWANTSSGTLEGTK